MFVCGANIEYLVGAEKVWAGKTYVVLFVMLTVKSTVLIPYAFYVKSVGILKYPVALSERMFKMLFWQFVDEASHFPQNIFNHLY